jgi:nitric oxide dioxygenase
MLEALAETNPARPVWHVQAALNGQTHAMGAHLRALAARMPGLTHTVFYSAPAPDDQDYDAAGHITTAWLTGHTPLTTADYYLCGPKPFLHALVNGLLQAGVPQARVHFEFFGPMQEVIEAKTV